MYTHLYLYTVCLFILFIFHIFILFMFNLCVIISSQNLPPHFLMHFINISIYHIVMRPPYILLSNFWSVLNYKNKNSLAYWNLRFLKLDRMIIEAAGIPTISGYDYLEGVAPAKKNFSDNAKIIFDFFKLSILSNFAINNSLKTWVSLFPSNLGKIGVESNFEKG